MSEREVHIFHKYTQKTTTQKQKYKVTNTKAPGQLTRSADACTLLKKNRRVETIICKPITNWLGAHKFLADKEI